MYDVLYEDVEEKMRHHPPDGLTVDAHDTARRLSMAHAKALLDLLPTSPEKSTVWAKLREALMWANAAIAIHGPKPHLVADDLASIRQDFGIGYGDGSPNGDAPL